MFEIEQLFANFIDAPAPEAKEHWARVYDEMTVHTQGRTPEKLIGTRRPYEDAGIKDYRLKVFEPVTKPPINKAIDNLQRLYSNANYRLKLDAEVSAYITESVFSDKDFIGYIASEVTRRMIEDPNGFLVWMPTGEGLADPTIEVDCKPILVSSKSTKIADNDSLVWLSKERSLVWYGNKQEMRGEVYYTATKAGFFKFVQVGKAKDKTFRLDTIYQQEFTYAPYILLGGELTQREEKDGEVIEYFESFFSSYLPFANEAIRQYSDYQGVAVTAMFPIREMESIECVAEGCRSGWIHHETEGKTRCGSCQGTGYVAPPSPYGVLIRPKPSGMGEEPSSTPAMRYISPDVAILKHAEEYWKGLLRDAEKALNLLFIDEAQSGIAKTIDREDKEAAIDRIGNNVYKNIVKNSLQIITDLRTMGTGAEPVIYLPSTFRVKSEVELIDDIANLRKEGAPEFVIAEATRDLMQHKYGSDPYMQKVVELLSEFDTFFSLTTEQKNTLLATGAMTEQEYLFSVHAPKYLRTLSKGEDFLDQTTEQIKTALDALLVTVINRRPIGNMALE